MMVAPIKFKRSMGGIVEIRDVKTNYDFTANMRVKTKYVFAVVRCHCFALDCFSWMTGG